MGEPVCVRDLEDVARKMVSSKHWSFLGGGAGDEHTLQDNNHAFKRYRLRPRILNDVSKVDLSTCVLGSHLDFPICAAPVSIIRIAMDVIGCDFPLAVARGVEAAGTAYTMSTWATCSIEEVVAAAPNTPKWFQLYLYKSREHVANYSSEIRAALAVPGGRSYPHLDRRLVESMVRRAELNGFNAIFITVDTQVPGSRYRQQRDSFPLIDHHRTGLQGEIMALDSRDGSGELYGGLFDTLIDPSLQWSDIAWVKSITKLPIVLKGILTGEMASRAAEFGVAGVVVSNHGGRQLNTAAATIDALPEVVEAVQGRCEVFIDGGILNGTDVLKALALGARAVFIGKPLIWGAVWKGSEGVKRVFEMLKDEFKTAMQLMGCRSIAELRDGKNLVVPQSFYHQPKL